MGRTKITQEQIIEINELYLKIGTYAGVSRKMGGSPSPTTVKKYIIPNYVSKTETETKKKSFSKNDLPEFNPNIFEGVDNWGKLCVLSFEEQKEIEELWNELII